VPNAAGVMPLLKMPSYREQVDVRDAWAIVAYFRALQRSQNVPFEQTPDRYRPELERTRADAGSGDPTTAVTLGHDTEAAR
jgi:hypothetical protein